MKSKTKSNLSKISKRMVASLTAKEKALLEHRFKGIPPEQEAAAPNDPAIERIAKELWSEGWIATEEEVIKKIRDIKRENRELHVDMRLIKDHVFQRAEESLHRVFEKHKRECSSQSMGAMISGAEAEDAVRMWHLIAHASGSSEVVNWVTRWCRQKIEALPMAQIGEETTQAESVLQQLIDDLFEAIDGGGFRS